MIRKEGWKRGPEGGGTRDQARRHCTVQPRRERQCGVRTRGVPAGLPREGRGAQAGGRCAWRPGREEAQRAAARWAQSSWERGKGQAAGAISAKTLKTRGQQPQNDQRGEHARKRNNVKCVQSPGLGGGEEVGSCGADGDERRGVCEAGEGRRGPCKPGRVLGCPPHGKPLGHFQEPVSRTSLTLTGKTAPLVVQAGGSRGKARKQREQVGARGRAGPGTGVPVPGYRAWADWGEGFA